MALTNPFTGGTTSPGLGRGGRGGNRRPDRNRNRNRGGGGGRTRVPNTGLYAGRAGKALANTDPNRFFETVLRRAGLINDSGNEFDAFARQALLDDLSGGYMAAQASRQRLDPIKWLRQTYGAGFRGKKGRNFQTGELTGLDAGLQGRYETYQANQNPLTYLLGQATSGSPTLPAGGNSEFATWYAQQFAPRLEAEYRSAALDTPGLNLTDWLAGQDTAERAQREFDTYRANADPRMWAVQQAGSRGLLPANGNAQFADWYANVYAPDLQRQFETARTGDANLNFNQFEAGRDPREARRLFAYRAPQYRQPSPNAPSGGRWSWWS